MRATVARGRRKAEALMTDTLLITRSSGNPVTNPDGTVTRPVQTVHAGVGRIQGRSTEGEDRTVAGADVLIVTFQAQVPVGVDLRPSDQVEVTASQMDPLMVGRTFRVESVVRKTHATKTTANVEEGP
ncbi:hypothetical protein GCM10009650_12530 [Nesterenkonia jeotgali]